MADRALRKRGRTRQLDSFNMTWLGLVAVTVVAVVVGALLVVKEAGVGYRQYTVEFLQAASLRPDHQVTVAGIEVGSVKSVELAGDHVKARLQVRDDVLVGRHTRAAIKVSTLFGSRYVELFPHGDGAPSNQTIDLAHTKVPYDLQEALADSTRTFEQVDADQIAASLETLNRQLDGLPDVVPQAMENVRALSSVIAQRREQLGALLESTQHVTNVLRRQQFAIGDLVHQGQNLIGEFVARSAAFRAMMQSLRSILDTMHTLVVDDRAAVEDVLGTMEELSAKFAEQDELFRNLLQIAPVPIRQIANATGFGNAIETNAPAGPLIDSWMCAISGRAEQFTMIQYFKDCQ